MVFSWVKVSRYCFSRLRPYWIHRTLYKNTSGTLSRLAWQKLPKTEAPSQSTVPLHWNSHFLETILIPLGQKPRKTPKTTPFWSRFVVGTRTPQILNDGASRHYRRLAEGLVHWNSLVSSFQVFLFSRYCQKYLKNAWFLAIFCSIFGIFVVLDATWIVPHVCIAHVSCFQSRLRMSILSMIEQFNTWRQ